MEMGSVGQWFAASATTAAVLVALFKDEFLKWRRRPILEVIVALEPPHCHSTLLQHPVQRAVVPAQCYYFRLWIQNNGKSRAEKVQVFAASLARRVADGSFRKDPNFLPMNLRWSHTMKPDGTPEIYAEGISPAMGKHCDIGHIVDPKYRSEYGEDLRALAKDESVFALDLEVSPNTRTNLLAPGTYQLELRVAASNCLPVVITLELTITGKWFEDESQMFRDAVGLCVKS